MTPRMLPFARATLALVAVAAVLAGCSSTNLDAKAPVENHEAAKPVTPPPATQPAASTVTPVDLGANKDTMAATTARIVYFDFDSFAIKPEYQSVIEGNARILKANAQKQMVVEGHTDERGGREYNLALGQKRAEAVVKSMTLLGAGDKQLEAVSFGKERPAVQGSNEEAWARNRRAELRDK